MTKTSLRLSERLKRATTEYHNARFDAESDGSGLIERILHGHNWSINDLSWRSGISSMYLRKVRFGDIKISVEAYIRLGEYEDQV